MSKYQASIGSAIQALSKGLDADNRLNVNMARPWVENGEAYVLATDPRTNKLRKVRVNASALLEYQEWLDIDREVIAVSTQRMVGIADLRNNNLEHNLGSIGVTVSLWQTATDMTQADINMSAMTKPELDSASWGTAQVPVPIVSKEFQIELRRLAASRRMGESVDVTQASIAGRLVAERSEQMLFSGANINVGGNGIYGYTTHPNRNTVDMATDWDDPTATGADIIADVQQMLAAARADLHFGPFTLYIPAAYEGKLDEDYRTNDDRTIRQRLMSLSGIRDIKVADFLPANNVVLVQLTRDVVDLAIGQDITTVQWSLMGGMAEEFKVMAVWVPRIKADGDGRSGIVHLRPAP